MIKKNQVVTIKSQWRDAGDEKFTWIALGNEEKGLVDIKPINTGLVYAPIYTVRTDWLEEPTQQNAD